MADKQRKLTDEQVEDIVRKHGSGGWQSISDMSKLIRAAITTYEALNADAGMMEAETWAELYKLREAIKGPDGFVTWQDAAIDERIRRVKAEAALATAQSSLIKSGYTAEDVAYAHVKGYALGLSQEDRRPVAHEGTLMTWPHHFVESGLGFRCVKCEMVSQSGQELACTIGSMKLGDFQKEIDTAIKENT